ncbi:MAG: endolytic transglycosylase MltG, partial [Chitinophagaceae bacterium]|nr:endolytic transglycosylase MltG [Chitinophagaceae bacterium]
MKKVLLTVFAILFLSAAIVVWIFFGPATGFPEGKRFLYIHTNSAKQAVIDSLKKNHLVKNISAFNWVANRLHYWKKIKAGKYEINKGANLINIVRMLRNGRQIPVNLVITKIRTKEDLAKLVGDRFECDSVQMINFLNNIDSLKKFVVDTTTVLSVVLPDTYTYYWNTTAKKIFQKLYAESKKFWTEERTKKAKTHRLTPLQSYILASIIEEETNNNAEKGNIASVYINRLNKGMPLQADPTIKFALKDFGLKRIYEKYLFIQSPYNTYRNKG